MDVPEGSRPRVAGFAKQPHFQEIWLSLLRWPVSFQHEFVILHLAHRIPYPPNKGDNLRAFRHIEHLSRSHDVTSAFFVDDPADWAHVETLRSTCRNVVAIRLRKLLATARQMPAQ